MCSLCVRHSFFFPCALCACVHLFEVISPSVLSMSGYPAFDLPPGYQFDPCGIPGFDPAVTFNPRSIPGVDPALIFQMPEDPETPETQEPTFELILTLIHSPKYLCTPNQRTRNPKPELENIGPFDVSVNIGWDAFLEMVAEKICIQHLDLPISTFE